MNPSQFPGTRDAGLREYESIHRQLSREAAAEGMVLLKNEGVLPLESGSRTALYGMGSIRTVKGGTGSGDVNSRETVSIVRGMQAAGFKIVNEDWLCECEEALHNAFLKRRDIIWSKVDGGTSFWEAYSRTPIRFPACPAIRKYECDAAFYILPRNAGENTDRTPEAGDYYLSQDETEELRTLCRMYPAVVLVLNTGGIVDLSILDELPQIKAVLSISQPGMEAGSAFADLVSGKVTPCGHLTGTWPLKAADHPCMTDTARKEVSDAEVYYHDGIYVGYRYFDTFSVPARFGFGDGLSYTDFTLDAGTPVRTEDGIALDVLVRNTGSYSGKEVVQLYVTCPLGGIDKEYRRLAAFAKTSLLAPGAEESIRLCVPADALRSFHPEKKANIIDSGDYYLWIGSSLGNSSLCAVVHMDHAAVSPVICAPDPMPEEDCMHDTQGTARRQQLKALAAERQLPVLSTGFEDAVLPCPDFSLNPKISAFSDDELIRYCVGNWVEDGASTLGGSGIHVPGAAGETREMQDVPALILADGPAGLRLTQTYYVQDGHPVVPPADRCMESGALARSPVPDGDCFYQYCTAFPVGTCLAQTWNRDLIYRVGQAVGEEMELFQVDFWLAPGMNIHRDPLCGRNFEYYSEDPCLSGLCAAAITLGVQSHAGCFVTIKHFACNNQETDRLESTSHVSERALREIYLRGFEIAIKESHPGSIMTSYNLVNGIHSANNSWLCTQVARREWCFDGFIMTDWSTTSSRRCTAFGCIAAGNDLIMPGCPADCKSIAEALRSGALSREDLLLCASRILNAAENCRTGKTQP